jgi:hypothetical protein
LPASLCPAGSHGGHEMRNIAYARRRARRVDRGRGLRRLLVRFRRSIAARPSRSSRWTGWQRARRFQPEGVVRLRRRGGRQGALDLGLVLEAADRRLR